MQAVLFVQYHDSNIRLSGRESKKKKTFVEDFANLNLPLPEGIAQGHRVPAESSTKDATQTLENYSDTLSL